jgi:hypothetical protein
MHIEKTSGKIDALNNLHYAFPVYYSEAQGGAHGNEEG